MTTLTPKFNKDSVPCTLKDNLINDSAEVYCQECDEVLDVEGCTDTEDGYTQFISAFTCPKCDTSQTYESDWKEVEADPDWLHDSMREAN